MAFITLGLDLGIASIGWTVISECSGNMKLEAWGSRIFEPGMDDDIPAGKGVSRCATRRQKRALRIQYKRRRERKDNLVCILKGNGMLPDPLLPAFFVDTDQNLLNSLPETERHQYAHVLPYLLRKKALDYPLSKEEFGRAIYHLAQRRGYLSNRKQELKDSDSGVVKDGIKSLRDEMGKTGMRTLGEYFSSLNPEKARIRTRYTDRAMFEEEFRKICFAQRSIVSEELEEQLHHAIFFQRKLKSNKGLIGKCRVYPDEPRCSMSREEAQLFRIYTTISNLRVQKGSFIRSLTEDERIASVALLNGFSDCLTRRGTITLSALGKKIKLGKGEKFTLGDDTKEIYGNELHAALYQVFGEKATEMSQEQRNKFFNDINSIEKDFALKTRLESYWGLSPLQLEMATKIMLPDTYCSFSLKALQELLPDLEANIPLNTILKASYPQTHDKTFDALPVFDSDECSIELRNPVVHRVMTELRTVVNAIIARYGKPDVIRIELARDLKSTNKERERMTIQLHQKEKERALIADKIAKEAGIERPSRNDILKVMLAEECGYECPYTGKHFTMNQLLHGKDIHIEHIIPYSRSFDDSFRNKTLCDASANSKKNNNTPYEAFGGKEYDDMLQRVSHFSGPYAEYKLDLFKQKEVNSEEFLSRNLNDTRYASKIAMQYLALLYGGIVDKTGKQRIFATSGGTTALVRRAWGGNYLLGEGEKVRSDHRHHAIDALTIALTTPDVVKKIASLSPEMRKKFHQEGVPLIDSELYEQARTMLDQAAVSHHVINKIRGAFHKETIYGKNFGNGVRHVRMKLADLSPDDIKNIVDSAIKKAILAKLGRISEEQVTKEDIKLFKDETNFPVLTDRKGNTVNTIKLVRVAKTFHTRSIGDGDSIREVANGANHVLAVFAELNDKGEETGWTGEIVSLLDARLRLQKGLPIFEKERPGLKFKFTLRKGDIVSWSKNGQKMLCIIRGVALPQFQMTLINEARMKKELSQAKVWFQPTLSAAFQGNMKKYRMNIFGELRDAND